MKSKKLRVVTSDDILGKEAVDPEGSILGVTTKVHIDKKTMKVTGITVDMGLLKPDLFIGSSYIKYFGVDAILLKRIPTDKYKGLKVLTEGGQYVGKVKKVLTERRRVRAFEITSNKFLGKKSFLDYGDIREIGENIVLKPKYNLIKK